MKNVSIMLTLFVFIISPSVSHANLSDINSSNNKRAIEYLVQNNVLSGYEDGTFKPTNTVNRAELLKILIAGLNVGDISSYGNCFSDVNNEWFSSYICYAKEKGWVNGYQDGTFRPSNPVTKVEAIKMLVNSQGYSVPTVPQEDLFNDVKKTDWFAPYVQVAKEHNLLEVINGDLMGSSEMTREKIAEISYRSHYIRQKGLEFYKDNEDVIIDSNKETIKNDNSQDSTFEMRKNMQDNKLNQLKVPCKDYNWKCTNYSVCSNGMQYKTCELNSQYCTNPEKVKPLESRSCIATEDPEADELKEIYMNWYENLLKAKYISENAIDGSVGLKLVEIYRVMDSTLNKLRSYSVLALTRELSNIEWKEINDLLTDLQKDSDYFLMVAKQDNKSNTNIYIVPKVNSPSYNNKVDCGALNAKIALEGGFGSGPAHKMLYEAGCSTKEQYCNGFALSGGRFPEECK